MDQSMMPEKRAAHFGTAPILRPPLPALGSLPSMALSPGTGGDDIAYISIKLQSRL